MLHLDTISRNLFGTGSVNSRDRSSTLGSNRSKSIDSRLSGESKRTSDQSLSPGPYKMFADRSEVDLNERLNLARKNSNIAAYSPAKPPRSPLNGLLPVNTAMPTRGDATPKSPGFSLRPSPLDSPSEDTFLSYQLGLTISTMRITCLRTHCSTSNSQQDTFSCSNRCSSLA
jgi:hypothetical protein